MRWYGCIETCGMATHDTEKVRWPESMTTYVGARVSKNRDLRVFFVEGWKNMFFICSLGSIANYRQSLIMHVVT
jgi:hypothetical protein